MPRRQDLERDEPDAFYSAEEVRELETNYSSSIKLTQLPIVSVSHAWETSVHPDPRGANLLLLVDAIKRAQTTPEETAAGEAKLLPSSLAVFFDFCSLFQRDPTLFEASETPEAKEEGEERDAFIAALKAKTAFYGGEAYDKSRSEAEGRPFKAALDNMEVWYAHAGTTVVLLTETPEGSSALAYLLRGWPTFESSVAMLIKPGVGPKEWPTLIDVSLRASKANASRRTRRRACTRCSWRRSSPTARTARLSSSCTRTSPSGASTRRRSSTTMGWALATRR